MKTKSYYLHILNFAIPIIIVSIIFALKGIIPFGDNTIFNVDAISQYSLFHAELADKLKSGDSLLYSFRNGLGTDFFVEATYYLTSPFNIFLLFASSENIALYFSIITILKLGLAGLCMGTYIKNHYNNVPPLLIISLSCCYSLCSYSVHYYSNVMWLDGFFLFPLIILCLEMLYQQKNEWLYSIILGITIISNFYLGFMICIFCVLYYAFLLFTDRHLSLKHALNNIGRFTLYSLIAGGISSLVIFPAFLGLITSLSGNNSATNLFSEYYPIYAGLFRLMFNASPTFMHSPYLYLSIIIFILFIPYVANTNIPKRTRIGKSILLLILLLSFQFKMLDYIWNGMHITKGFAGRQSFIFIFLLITIIIEGLQNYSKKDLQITISFAISSIIMIASYIYYDLTSILYLTIFNLVLLIFYYLIFKKFTGKKLLYICCIFMLVETILSAYSGVKPSCTKKVYTNYYEDTDTILQTINDDSFYRIKNDCKVLLNEGCILKYNSIPIYSSFTSDSTSDTLMSFGYYIGDNAYDDYSFEPVSMSLLGIKYIISDKPNINSQMFNMVSKSNNKYLYKNNNSLSIGFAVPGHIPSNDMFSTDNPFETINSIVYSISGIKEIYNPVTLSTQLPAGKDIYLYSQDILGNTTFKALNGTEEILYPIEKTLVFAKKHNYIFHITDSIYGGTFETNSNLSDVIAYSLNHDKYYEFMNMLSTSVINVDSYSSSHIEGHISVSEKSSIFTSIPNSYGWTVKVDGKITDTYNINNNLLAFDVEKGDHIITFTYTTKGLPIGSLLSIISLIVLVIITVISKKKH